MAIEVRAAGPPCKIPNHSLCVLGIAVRHFSMLQYSVHRLGGADVEA